MFDSLKNIFKSKKKKEEEGLIIAINDALPICKTIDDIEDGPIQLSQEEKDCIIIVDESNKEQ